MPLPIPTPSMQLKPQADGPLVRVYLVLYLFSSLRLASKAISAPFSTLLLLFASCAASCASRHAPLVAYLRAASLVSPQRWACL